MKWGIIGFDFIANDFAEELYKTNQLLAMAGEGEVERSKFKSKFAGISMYNSVDELLSNPEIDVVYISTYANIHCSIIKRCLEFGKHVFCEKPMFLNEEEALYLWKLAKERNLHIGEANTIFYMPIIEKVKKDIQEGSIGDFKMITIDFGSLKEESDNPVFQKEKAGGALYDIGIYALVILLTFMDVEDVQIKSLMEMHHYGVDERWNILLKNNKGQLGSINLSLRNKLEKRCLIAGDKAYYEIMNYPRADCIDVIYPDMTRKAFKKGIAKEALRYEINGFEEDIKMKNDDKMIISLQALEIMDRLRKENKIL